MAGYPGYEAASERWDLRVVDTLGRNPEAKFYESLKWELGIFLGGGGGLGVGGWGVRLIHTN